MGYEDFSTTPLQKEIYVLIINYENPKFPRTQKQVCDMLDISKSTCSDAVKRLVKLGFLRPYPDMTSNILYAKGKHHKIMESHINSNFLESKEWYDKYGHAIRPTNTAEPYRPTWRTHVNGTWLMFIVSAVGDFAIKDERDVPPKEVFNPERFSSLPGSKNYYGMTFLEGVWTKVRYQETNSKKLFYVQSTSMIQTASELTDDDDLSPFLPRCNKILAWFERFGYWKFKHTDTGGYEVAGSIKIASDSGTQKEYGADEFSTELINTYLGESVGIIGESPTWYDKSPTAQGKGEREFRKSDYVYAFDLLPDTRDKVEALIKEKSSVRVQILELDVRIDKIELKMMQFFDRISKYVSRNQELISAVYGESEVETDTTSTTTSSEQYEGMYR